MLFRELVTTMDKSKECLTTTTVNWVLDTCSDFTHAILAKASSLHKVASAKCNAKCTSDTIKHTIRYLAPAQMVTVSEIEQNYTFKF